MTVHRSLPAGSTIPYSFPDALTEFLSTYASPNFAIQRLGTTGVQVVAGPGNDQVALGITGLWRWNALTVNATHPGGGAATYDVWAITAANESPMPPASASDDTVYGFTLQITATGSPPAAATKRKVGEVVWNGSAITDLLGVFALAEAGLANLPTGMLVPLPYSGSVPLGFLACNGAQVSRSTYGVLFGVIGTAWGAGDGTSTFHLPSLSGRYLIGKSGTKALGSYGGADTVTVSLAQLPAHTHGAGLAAAGAHTHTVSSETGHAHVVGGPPAAHSHGGAVVQAGYHHHNQGDSVNLVITSGLIRHSTIGNLVLFAAEAYVGWVNAPDHTHTIDAGDSAHQHVIGSAAAHSHGGSVSIVDHTHTVANAGGGGAHDNLSPFATFEWAIKT